jgi:hypothetical protein
MGVSMKASLLSLVPVVLGLSFSNLAMADEPPAEVPAVVAAVPEASAEVDAPPTDPVFIPQVVQQDRPGPIASPMAPAPAEPKPVPRVKSKAMIIVGSILSGVGAANLVAGSVLMARAESEDCDIENDSLGLGTAFCGMGQGFDKMIASALLISGGVHSAAGIPLIAVGSQAPGKQPDEAPATRADLHVSATGATFTLSF